MPQLEWVRNAEPRIRAHSGSKALTPYNRRRQTAKYSIRASFVFDKIIRLSRAQHRPMQITTVDDERTQRYARIRMQIVDSAAETPCQQHAIE